MTDDDVNSATTPRDASDARSTLDAWRASGADRGNPLRFQLIVALERRAAAYDGDARRVLDRRLSSLIEAYALDVERTSPEASAAESASEEARKESLAALADYVARQGSAHREDTASAAYPELPALDYFRGVWSKVRTEKQIRQSLAPVPGNAGPLNSGSLVHRALSLMSELSPGYLKQFLSYVDTLSLMEQMNGGAPAPKDTPRAGAGGKGGRGKAAR